MFGNPYMNSYNPQVSIDRINNQIAELEKMKQQIPQQPMQPTNLTQNFQISPTNREVIKYANSIEEVQRDMVIGDTPYFSKDMGVVWIKNTKGDIKTYELTEILPTDEKDMQISLLQNELKEVRKELKKYEQSIADANETKISTNTETIDEPVRESIEENKPTSIQRVSRSKTK